jgi:hypothetical protein
MGVVAEVAVLGVAHLLHHDRALDARVDRDLADRLLQRARLALLAVTVAFVTWLAGKVYRVGILSTGKKPTLREMARGLRAA